MGSFCPQSLSGATVDRLASQWDEECLLAITAIGTVKQPTVVARTVAILHTCMFDAWAAYDPAAVGTRLGATLRRPVAEHTLENKRRPSVLRPTAP